MCLHLRCSRPNCYTERLDLLLRRIQLMGCAPITDLMRLCHCDGTFHRIPCLPKSKDVSGGVTFVEAASPAAGVVATAEEQPPPVQKIEVAVAGKDNGDDGIIPVVATVAAPRKSCLKKTTSGDKNYATKGNVQWLDLVGKDLTEVKEFEPSECEDSLDEGDDKVSANTGSECEDWLDGDEGNGKASNRGDGKPACACVIQ